MTGRVGIGESHMADPRLNLVHEGLCRPASCSQPGRFLHVGVQLHVPAGGQATHSCAALFLEEGLYKLHVQPITARAQTLDGTSESQGKSMLAICANPLYIMVS